MLDARVDPLHVAEVHRSVGSGDVIESQSLLSGGLLVDPRGRVRGEIELVRPPGRQFVLLYSPEARVEGELVLTGESFLQDRVLTGVEGPVMTLSCGVGITDVIDPAVKVGEDLPR